MDSAYPPPISLPAAPCTYTDNWSQVASGWTGQSAAVLGKITALWTLYRFLQRKAFLLCGAGYKYLSPFSIIQEPVNQYRAQVRCGRAAAKLLSLSFFLYSHGTKGALGPLWGTILPSYIHRLQAHVGQASTSIPRAHLSS